MRLEPLVLTVRMDRRSFAYLDRLRREHFPAGRNLVPAHVTLFHQLPGHELQAVIDHLADVCSRRPAPILTATGVRFLGRGVAIDLSSDRLRELRGELARSWSEWLTPQDMQTFRPHVTIQNKVTPATAKALHAGLLQGFTSRRIKATGLCLWRYKGGPWERLDEFAFASHA